MTLYNNQNQFDNTHAISNKLFFYNNDLVA